MGNELGDGVPAHLTRRRSSPACVQFVQQLVDRFGVDPADADHVGNAEVDTDVRLSTERISAGSQRFGRHEVRPRLGLTMTILLG